MKLGVGWVKRIDCSGSSCSGDMPCAMHSVCFRQLLITPNALRLMTLLKLAKVGKSKKNWELQGLLELSAFVLEYLVVE